MPWETRGTMEQHRDFVHLALTGEIDMPLLCKRYKITTKTGYKWIKRFRENPDEPLADRSRRPKHSPARTRSDIEKRVIDLRLKYPARGGRTLWQMLKNQNMENVPAPSTITDILRRHGLIDAREAPKHTATTRFERAHPNELWQMDFKGPVQTDAGRCHPLTLLDDHSRYSLELYACADQRTPTVKNRLTAVFRLHGLPSAILCDNGPPWGAAGAEEPNTELSVWLMRVGVRVLHGRPYHPQTQGKEERFHRTLNAEVLGERFADVTRCQMRFDEWRPDYNWNRPHHALGLDVPGHRYRPSPHSFPETLREPDYSGTGMDVRKVDKNGAISMWGKTWKVGKAFAGQWVALEPTSDDHIWHVRFHGFVVKKLNRLAVE